MGPLRNLEKRQLTGSTRPLSSETCERKTENLELLMDYSSWTGYRWQHNTKTTRVHGNV